ncbi:autotransporter domain-containing protein [Desulfovibrio fairfieldensis]|uniref:Autotransporter domain-containing protein n=1 Tax=Desulfovibrio fairfieldensis TaxID=44742 RepID=A0A0X8JI63_9BACT|nr:autotransporter domain-containing protein [Desulfovibrio fairfieldensis]AMD88992.1 hypothetical protein AXF13_02030 [Desulfovibrio fairfieldensis]
MLTKGAIGNLVNKYRAVLKKCGLLNIFGSLALAGALTVGAAGMAVAADISISGDATYSDGTSVWTEGDISITNGNVSVSGKGSFHHPSYPNETWRAGSMIWAENSLNMSGGTVTLDNYGGMGVSGDVGESSKDHQLNITGGEVKLNSSDSNQVAYLRASATADYSSVLNLGGGTGTATVSVANGKHGFIAAETLNMNKGGSITVTKGGYLTLAGSLLFKENTNAVINPASPTGLTISAGKNGLLPNLNLNDATIVVNDDANVKAGNLNFSNSASTISGLHGSDADSTFTFGADSTAGPTVVLENGGAIGNNGQIVIASGNFTVAGVGTYASKGVKTEEWRKASMISSETGITVNGGSITLGDHGLLSVSDHASTPAVLSLNGGTIYMDGSAADKAAVIRLTEADQNTVAAKFTLSDGSLNVGDGKYGVIAVADNNFDVQGGTLNVARNGTLELIAKLDRTAGAALVSTAAGKGLTVTGTSLEVSDGAVNVKDGLTLNKDGKVNVSGGTLVVDGATTWTPVSGGDTSGKLTIGSGSVTLMESSILGAYDAGTQKYAVADQLTKNNALDTDKLGLTGGVLYLTRTESYTTAQLGAASTALNGSTVAFLGAKLETENATDVHINGTQTGGVGGAVTIASGNKTTIETGGASVIDVPLPDNSVAVTDNSKNLLTTNDITLNSSNTAGGLTVGNTNTDTAVKLTFDGSSTNTLVGVNGSLVQNEQGQAIITDAEVKSGSTLNLGMSNNVNAQQVNLNNLTVAGTVVFDGNNDSTYSVAGKLNLSGQVNALNSVTTINELDGTGTLYVDPAYVSIATLTGGTLGSALLVGDGSVVNIGGMSGADLRTALAEAGMSVGPNLTLGDGQSALALASPVTLSGAGKIVVDANVDNSGSINANPVTQAAYFGADSALVVDASKLNGKAAITGTGTSTALIAPDARLQVVNATKGEVTLLADFAANGITSDGATGTDYGWVKNSVANPDRMLTSTAAVDAAAGSVTLTNTVNKASDVLPGLDGELNPAMADVWDNAQNDVNAEARGVRFLSRAARADYIADARQAAVTIESAARMALVGAVPQMTMAASNAAGNAVTQRTGLAQPGGNAIQSMGTDGSMQTGASAGDAAKTGFAMWIMPLYQSSNGFGMKAGNFDMDFSGGLGGVAIGADYTFDNAIRAGITFNIGGGYAQGSGDLNETTNNMNFWGIGAYAGWAQNNFGVTADVNYTSTYNKLEQDLPASMQMGKLKSDVTAYAISAGLRGEYKFETSVMDITPHVGVRYMSLNTDEYDVKSGGTLLKGDAINQNIWTFPVGVAFSKQIETGNGWHFKPSLDLAVIPAAGDIDARSDVRFTGTGTKAELDTQTMDYVSYMGQAGLEFGNDTTSLGVNYNIQLGAKSTAHGVFGTFRYEF